MAEVILMPRLSDTMTEGVIATWHKNIGDSVKKGDVLAEIETDKATMELESFKEGILLHRGGDNGAKIAVNELLAIIGKEGEDIAALIQENGRSADSPNKNSENKEVSSPAVVEAKEEKSQPGTKSSGNENLHMDEVVLMPRLSDTMTEGVIASWHKNIGDDVKKGDVIAEIETDKATMELESYKDGKMLYRGAEEGKKIAVNDLLCIIGKDGTDVEALVKAVKSGGAAASAGAPATNDAQEQGSGKEETATFVGTDKEDSGRIFISPLARKMAEEKGIDIKKIKGTGDNGRITKSDVENYKPAAAETSTQQPAKTSGGIQAAPTQQTGKNYEEVAVSQMRKTIARRLSESKFGAPHFYLTMSINMDAAMQARSRMNEISKTKISFNDLVLKAAAVALTQHPKVNSSWMGDTIRMNHNVNIGVAVAVEEGLLVPVVKDANHKSLSSIAAEVKTFAQKAKDKKLQPSDWEGNTFTISNLGMFGIEEFTAIINPPDACILAVGAINKVPAFNEAGEVVAANIMKVTLSCDHRVVDGATGAAFLQTLKALLEEPLTMLV